jgi:hypothetical protein
MNPIMKIELEMLKNGEKLAKAHAGKWEIPDQLL